MQILYSPISNDLNRYIAISQEALRKCGCEIIDFESGRKSLKTMMNSSAVIMNWYESTYRKTAFRLFLAVFKKKLPLVIFRLFGGRIVYVFHNRVPHDVKEKAKKKILKNFIRWMCKKADYIITLSESSTEYLKDYLNDEEIEQKNRYIPHPNYIGVYASETEENAYPKGDKFKVLMVGQIRKYKNIDIVLDVAEKLRDKNIEFDIFGMPTDPGYVKEVAERAKLLSNVNFVAQAVKDEEMSALLSRHHALVLPYDINSCMNSGVAILAFSNHRTVISSLNCTIRDVDPSDVYSYSYDTDEQHVDRLYGCVLDAYNDWISDRQSFEEKGRRLYNRVKECNSPEIVFEGYKSLLGEISHDRNSGAQLQ